MSKLELMLALKQTASALMMLYVCIEAYRELRRIIRWRSRTRSRTWLAFAKHSAIAMVTSIAIIGGLILFTGVHIGVMNGLWA
jgi:hypothetical protein